MALESLPWGVGVGDFAMDGFGSFRSHNNNNNDYYSQNTEELKQKLLQTTLELETLRTTAKEEMRKKEENINKLIQLIKLTTKERDEVKEQVNALLSFLQSKKTQQPAAINSGLTESDSLSDAQTSISHRPHVSSPVESFYHADSSNISTAAPIPTATVTATKFDYGSVIIDELAKKRPLPENGKLLHAVMNAGPLLQTLMVAGPLPMWRNPPPVQTCQVSGSRGFQLCVKGQITLPLDNRYTDCSVKRLRTF
ncbi:enabled-like protein (DUF1635) [Rhynchospora pubera]|uniref:Enabled-like protein (DUF1635) n=1 Tax=Rhynchospora pubera TaxID=906938 RepID=A0AAV8CJU7_9POAL|nr:enabled-like protein (DUF1635) [Rhynchospora pubera]